MTYQYSSSPIHLHSRLVLQQPTTPFRSSTPVAPLSSPMATPTVTSITSQSTTSSSIVASTVTMSSSSATATSSTVAAAASATSSASTNAPYQFIVDSGIPGPGSFFGDSTQDARDWMRTFESWVSIRRYDEPTQIAVFTMLLKISAARWFDTLTSTQKTSFDSIKAAFYKRFAEVDEWTDFQKVSQLRQGSSEPVVEYLERAMHLLKRVKLPEEHAIRAMTAGLKPQIQSFAIQQGVATFQQLSDAALLAEKSFKSTATDDVLSAIHKLEDTMKDIVMNSSPNQYLPDQQFLAAAWQ